MVWGLFPVDPLSGEDKYYIFRCGIYKIGRKGCDVIINKDKGVSRVHAEIVVHAMTTLNTLHKESSDLAHIVQIRDCSKYGTFISKNVEPRKKVHELPNKEAALEDGNLVSFGTGSATYRFCYIPLLFFVCSSDEVDQSLEERVSSIGGRITNTIGQECTHVLVDQIMPLKNDLIDAVVAKKPFVLNTWVEFVAEKNIGTEIPSSNSSYIPTLSVEGTSVRVADPNAREHCLKGYTFLLESMHLYKFGARLKSLLEVCGAKVVAFEEFCSNSQGSDYGEDNRVVCIIPGGPSKSDRINKLSSLSRVNEMDIVSAALSGQLDLSILISPCVLVSSSCSTDETVVADSDTEVETATSAHARETLCKGRDVKHAKTERSLDDAPASVGQMKCERMETSLGDVSARFDVLKRDEIETALDGASSRLDNQATSFREGTGSMTVRKDKVDDSESRNSDIIYSQDLIVRDIYIPSTANVAPNSSLPNFKRFRKVQIQSGNSFSNLVPFAKYPYKDSDYGNEEISKSVKEEKKRKQMEAIAEDLFNNEKARKRGTAGSLRGILIS